MMRPAESSVLVVTATAPPDKKVTLPWVLKKIVTAKTEYD